MKKTVMTILALLLAVTMLSIRSVSAADQEDPTVSQDGRTVTYLDDGSYVLELDKTDEQLQAEQRHADEVQGLSDDAKPQSGYVAPATSTTLRRSRAAASYPARYSAADAGYVTSVKDQGSFGTCWVFSTAAALESNLIKQGLAASTVDLSELFIAYYAYNTGYDEKGIAYVNNVTPDNVDTTHTGEENTNNFLMNGGNVDEALFTIMRQGIPLESTLPYSQARLDLKLDKSYSYSNMAYQCVGSRQVDLAPANRNAVKAVLMEYGAGVIDIAFQPQYCNYLSGGIYNPTNSGDGHSIELVGWDDNYSSKNFLAVNGAKPAGNGAWIIKNSWGSASGDRGYYYISYYDSANTAGNAANFLIGAANDGFDRIDQYDTNSQDPLNWAFTSAKAMTANCFKVSQPNGYLQAAGFYLEDLRATTAVSLQIYTGLTASGAPGSGTLAYSATVDAHDGYNHVTLPTPIRLAKDSRYAIVVKQEDAAGQNVMMVDSMAMIMIGHDGFRTLVYSNANASSVSYFSTDGGNHWDDLNYYYSPSGNVVYDAYANWRIRGYVVDMPDAPDFSLTHQAGSVSVAIVPVTGATGYGIYRATDETGPFTKLDNAGAVTYLDHPTGSPTGHYYYQVQADQQTRYAIRRSPLSQVKDIILSAVSLDDPLSVAVGTLRLDWAAALTADGYDVYRKTHGAADDQFVKINANLLTATTYQDVGLDPTASYDYRIRASLTGTDGTVTVYDSNTVTGRASLSGLTSEQLKSTAATKSQLSWPAVEGATGYLISRLSAEGTYYIPLGSTDGQSYVDAASAANASFTYMIQPYADAEGIRQLGQPAVITVITQPITPWFSYALGDAYDEFTLTVRNYDPALTYTVSRDANDGAGFVPVATMSGASWSDAGLTLGVRYGYKFTAIGLSGIGVDGEISSQKIVYYTAQYKAPTNFKVKLTACDAVMLSWDAVAKAESYIVKRSTSQYFYEGTYVDIPVTGTSFHDTGLRTDLCYWYTVGVATDKSEGSIPSEHRSVVMLPPVSVTAVAVNGRYEIDLSWSWLKSNAQHFIVMRDGQQLGVFDAIYQYADTDLQPNTTYTYQVVPGVQVDGTWIYNQSSPSATVTTAPAVPVLTVSQTADRQLTLAIAPIDGASGIDLYRSVDGGSLALLTATDAASYVDDDVLVGHRYAYAAVAKAGTLASPQSAPIDMVVGAATPQLTASTESITKVRLSWPQADGAVNYEVYRAASADGEYSLIATTAQAGYVDAGLTRGTTYYYQVRALGSQGYASAYSSVVSGMPLLTTHDVKAYGTSGSNRLTISWQKAEGASGYLIYYRTSTTGRWKLLKTVTSGSTTSYTKKGLSYGRRYYFSIAPYQNVVSYRKVGRRVVKVVTKSTDVWSAASAMTSPNKVSIRKVRFNEYEWHSATVFFRTVSGADAYQVYRSTRRSGGYVYVATVTGSSFTDNSLLNGTRYYYKVRALNYGVNGTVYGSFSSYRSIRMPVG